LDVAKKAVAKVEVFQTFSPPKKGTFFPPKKELFTANKKPFHATKGTYSCKEHFPRKKGNFFPEKKYNF